MQSIQNPSAFKISSDMSALVNTELEQDRNFHPNLGGITRGGIANHYPMTILALQGLGASDEEVASFRRSWPRHRAELAALGLRDAQEITAANWPAHLGRSDTLLAFRRVFTGLLAEAPADAVIAHVLQIMQNSLPMGLFHPLIRLSFAAGHGDPGLIADALAYMAIRYTDMFQQLAQIRPMGTGAEIWRNLEGLPALPPGGSLRVCEQLCADPELQRAAGFPAAAAPEAEICLLALRLYLHEPALTTLHAVTSAQALAELAQRASSEYASVYQALWRRYWIWLSGLYLEKGKPAGLPGLPAQTEARELPDWQDLAAQARAVPEVHLIKMAYSCRWLDLAFGPEPLYRVAVRNMLRERRAHPRHRGLPLLPL